MWFQPTDCGEGKECDHGSCARLHGEIAVKPKIYYIIPFQRHATCNEVQLDFTPEISGQPKGLSFGFRPKFSVSVGAETFRQNFPFGQKTSYGRNAQFRPKYCYFGRNITALSAERVLFRQFRLSAEIEDFGLPSFGFGRNSFGWPLPEMEVLYMLLERCHTKKKIGLTNSI